MRFSTLITRSAPATAGKVTIGSDSLDPYNANPTVSVVGGNSNLSASDPKLGCVHVSRVKNLDSFPLQRIAIGLVPPKGSSYPADNLTVTCWVFEEASQTWFQVPVSINPPFSYTATLVPHQLIWFDPPALMDFANVNTNDGGKLAAFFLIASSSVSALPAGDYLFPVGSDVSNPGF